MEVSSPRDEGEATVKQPLATQVIPPSPFGSLQNQPWGLSLLSLIWSAIRRARHVDKGKLNAMKSDPGVVCVGDLTCPANIAKLSLQSKYQLVPLARH